MANAHIHARILEKPQLWLNGPLWAKWYVCFLIHCLRFVIAILSRSKSLLISWLQSLSALILKSKKSKCFTVSTFSPSICHEVIGPDAMILLFWMLSSKPAFTLSFNFIKRLYNVYFSNWSAWFFKVWMWSIKTPLLLRILTCISIQFLNILQYYILIRMKILHCSPL